MVRSGRWTRSVVVSVLLILPAVAADVPAVTTGNTEIGGFAGISYGIDKWRGMYGGNVVYALTRHIMPYGEFSYFPGIQRTETGITPPFPSSGTATAIYSIPLTDFHGGVHLRVPVGESRVVPYGVFGAGVVHSSSRTEQLQVPDNQGVLRTFSYAVPSRSDFAVNFGGGLRFYLTESFGMRVEGKAYRPTGQFSDVFGKIEVGFFFQIR